MKTALITIATIFCCDLEAQEENASHPNPEDFPIHKILNYSSTTSTFRHFNSKLLIIDFFATWCVPCLKALPHLTALQQQYKNNIHILLVSEEAQDKLTSFIQKRHPFALPIVVDEDKKFISLFQPPSYPYTVVVGKNNAILALPSQEELTQENINKWLNSQETPVGLTLRGESRRPPITDAGIEPSANKLVQLSQEFMYAAKTGDETAGYVSQFQHLSINELKKSLVSDDNKKAFWINLYNAYTQVALKKDSAQYKKRSEFFGSKQIKVAGNKFSLDDIEHGILRRSKIKWSLGYFNKLFPGKIEKRLRVTRLDYRLHFALNCGAKSCPPIAFYRPENIDQQLDIATRSYLESEVKYNVESNTVTLPAIMNWFRRDFGGKKKMMILLRQLSIVPADKNPAIKFKEYNWSLYLENYKT